MFALPWLITWFAHCLGSMRSLARLFDYLLAAPPLAPLYFSVAILLHFRRVRSPRRHCSLAPSLQFELACSWHSTLQCVLLFSDAGVCVCVCVLVRAQEVLAVPSSEFADLHHLLTNLANRERDALESALLGDADAPTRAAPAEQPLIVAAAAAFNANSNAQSADAPHTRAQSCPPAGSPSAQGSQIPPQSAAESAATARSLPELPRAAEQRHVHVATPKSDHKARSRSDSKSSERREEAVEEAAQMDAAGDEEMQGDWGAEGHEPLFEATAAASAPAAAENKQCVKPCAVNGNTIAPPLATDLHVEPQGDWAADADDAAPVVEDDEPHCPAHNQTAHPDEASEPQSHPKFDEAATLNADALQTASNSAAANSATQSTKPKTVDASDVFPIDEIIQRSCTKVSSSLRHLLMD